MNDPIDGDRRPAWARFPLVSRGRSAGFFPEKKLVIEPTDHFNALALQFTIVELLIA